MSKQTNKNHTEDRIDFDHVIFQALVNEGKHLKVLHARRPPLQYNEKDLREAAHAEVANSNGQIQAEEIEKGNKKRKNMDATERAQQSRDRNREHAKNTRLRKKAYVAKLKELVDHMQKVKDAEESERVHLGEKIYETQVIRKNAVKLFMSYRASNIKDRAMWSQILDESVTLVLPITPYRSFHKGEIKYSSRVLHGIDAVIVDTASLNLMAECIGQSSPEWKEALKRNESCRVTFHTTPEDILAAGDLVMCRYVMRIDGCDMVGGGVESCVQHGMMTCKFDRHNKILSVENMFDVMGYMQQLQRAAAISPESSIVPNTLDMALQPSKECQAIVKAVMPYPVLHINEAWTNLTGSSQSAAEGMILSQALRVYPFQNNLIFRLAADCVLGRAGSTIFMSNDASHKSEQQSQQAVSSSLSGSNSFNDNSSFGTGTNSNNNNNNNNKDLTSVFSSAKVLDPCMRRSTEFPQWVQDHREQLKDKKVLMYCTAGVRCERASSFLKNQGIDDVYQLEGGIHRYLDAFPEDGGFWKGKNYTFDKRFNHGASSAEVISTCVYCEKPWDRYQAQKKCGKCNMEVILCKECQKIKPSIPRYKLICPLCKA